MPFYNCHIHVFSAQCAPKRFLQVGLPAALDPIAGGVKDVLETRVGRWISFKLAKIKWAPFKVAARYASFASVGTMSSQQMVFENILKFYPTGSRFIVLSLNMDHMGAGPSELTYLGQIDQIVQLRRLYPDACLPFLSIDPRMGTDKEILSFTQHYVGPGLPFIGIKLYPALGYFPFDKRLDPLFQFCEENEVPIMTHCTPSGAFFLGKLNATLGLPETIDYTDANGTLHKPPLPLPHSFPLKSNDENCDVFLKPENWSTVLAKYPKLKICFAHMGGVGEIKKSLNGKPNWFDDVKSIMAQYENIYTDVSYTVSVPGMWPVIKSFLDGSITSKPWKYSYGKTPNYGNTLANRILFGTDYFMTEQEDSEKNLAVKLSRWLLEQGLLPLHKQLTERNVEGYLQSLFFTP